MAFAAQRAAESKKGCGDVAFGASVEFVQLDGDAHLEIRAAHAIKLAGILRRLQPETVLAPSTVENQHPDHWRLGKLVRDASRLARYGGLKELRGKKAHAIRQLFFYAVTPEAEPPDITPVLIDISAPEILAAWTFGAWQRTARRFQPEIILNCNSRCARLLGLRAGTGHAMALFPNEPLGFESLKQAGQGARRF